MLILIEEVTNKGAKLPSPLYTTSHTVEEFCIASYLVTLLLLLPHEKYPAHTVKLLALE